MAYKRYGAQKSNSRYGAAKKGYGSNKRSAKKEKKENDPLKPFIILKPFEPEEDEGKRYPDLTGFVNISPEFVELLNELEVDEQYGTIKGITVAVWEQPDGSLMGSLSHYVPEEEDEPAPKKRTTARTATKTSTAKGRTSKSTNKKTAPPPEEDDEESDEELDDIPF